MSDDAASLNNRTPSQVAQSNWRRVHLSNDRAVLQVMLPFSQAREVARSAAALGISKAAYVSAVLALAAEHQEQIPDLVRLLAHVHGIGFRSARTPSSDAQDPTADDGEGTP